MSFSDLGRKLSKLGQDTKNGVQKVSDSVTISNRISQEKKSLERLFALIGEAVYKENPDTPKEGLEDEWAAVKVAYANIASYTEQLNHVKGLVYCPNCGKPAAAGDKFCAKCGFRLNIRPETTGAKMAKDLKEAGQEAGKIAGDAAERTGEAVGGAAAGTRNAFSWLKGKLKKNTKHEDGESAPEAARYAGGQGFTEAAEDAPFRGSVQESSTDGAASADAGAAASTDAGAGADAAGASLPRPERESGGEAVKVEDKEQKAGVEEAAAGNEG